MSNSTENMKKSLKNKKLWRKPWPYFAAAAVLAVLVFTALQIPAIRVRASNLYASLYYRFNPPSETVFDPSQQGTVSAQVIQTLTALAPTATDKPTSQPVAIDETPLPTATHSPTATPYPVPANYSIENVGFVYQDMNNCGPANLSINVSYWGWPVTQDITEAWLKSHPDDRNVMLSEMRDYVESNTNLKGLIRFGGNMDVIKRFISNDIPVLIERGHTDPKDGWMGHYGLISAYDDTTGLVTIPDTLLGMIEVTYGDLLMDWAHFDGIFLIVYPPEKEQLVSTLLGKHLDPEQNLRLALEQVEARMPLLNGRELFFALYSKGSILVEMENYFEASLAYDQAFSTYASLNPEERPWRITWYQVGPYPAYYYTGRYQDVLNLAQQTLDNARVDSLPETWYWAGKAAVQLGETDRAISYFKGALEWYPNWDLVLTELAELGS